MERALAATASSWRVTSVVLLAWQADGTPVPVAAWGNRAARVAAPVTPTLIATGWLSQRSRGAVLQPGGSIIVGVAADDPAPPAVPGFLLAARAAGVRVDTGFGIGGIAECRLPDDGYRRRTAAP